MIYVWALEQKESRRGWDEEHDQDVMVPWVMKGKKDKSQKLKRGERQAVAEDGRENRTSQPAEDKTFLRYYHLYRKGELESDVKEAGGEVVESGYEKDNWWAIVIRRA